MLYVFLVDTGTMMQLDMNLALEKVEHLKSVIAQSCSIPPEKQVLLISGGESLDANETVCKYSMGTDTNPIFLFSMVSIESALPPEVPSDYDTGETSLNEKVESSLSLRDTQSTVAIRASLAQEYVKASTAQTRSCETLIHDQHLQHQGWLAVVGNLEDLATDVQKQLGRMESSYNAYLTRREEYRNLVDSFDEDLAILHRIPVFPSLLKADITESMAGSVVLPEKPYDVTSGDSINLLEWINSRGSNQSLEQVADSCYRAIQQMDDELLTELKGKVLSAVEGSGNNQMKEIRGLGDRLAGLEQLLLEAKRLVQEQQDMAQAFLQNQQRASGLRDNSILPDLCASHKQQLIVMKENHSRVICIRARCSKAKAELSANLHRRMKWVVFIQDQMAEVGRTLLMHAEEVRRLNRKMEVIEQIHTAPAIYMATAVEVVRRKAFSNHYLTRASSLADSFSSLHKEEITLRTNYQSKIKKHFLSKMFPGMEDYPPPFANDCPEKFDNRLPEITLSDVEVLRQKFPDLAKSLSVPECNALSNLLARSFNEKLTVEEGETLYSLQNLPGKIKIQSNDIASVSIMNRLISEQPPNGRKKFRKHPSVAGITDDSETDTDADIDHRRQNGPTKRRDRCKKADNNLTRSLPLESSVLTLKSSTFQPNDNPKNILANDSKKGENGNDDTIEARNGHQSNGSVGNADNHISSSSADPSTSSGGNTSGSVAPSSSSDGSALLNSRLKVNGVEVASELSDRSTSMMIESLNCKVISAEAMYKKLQDDVKKLCISEDEDRPSSLQTLKKELIQLKIQVLDNLQAYDSMIKDFSKALAFQVFNVENLRKKDTEERLRKQSESDSKQAKSTLELEQNKLEDCHREIEMYRQQLEHSTREVDRMKSDGIEENEKFVKELKEKLEEKEKEKDEEIKKLLLEHELELESLKQEFETSEKVLDYQQQIALLKVRLHNSEQNVTGLTEKIHTLENTQEQNLKIEKDKIVQILEAGFAQREKLSMQEIESELEIRHGEILQEAVNEHQIKSIEDQHKIRAELIQDKEDSIRDMKKQYEREYEELQNRQQDISAAAVELERQKFIEEQNKALQLQAKQMRSKFKCDMDGLRARFKMMQTTGALDRSPSASESELYLESPRQDLVDSIRSAIAQEYENNLRAERSKWERQMLQLRDDHEQALAEIKSKHKLRDSAEHQIMFNEALAKLKTSNSDKDNEIIQLKSTLQLKIKELEEKEKSMSTSTMGASVMAVPPESSTNMTKSVNQKLKSGKISVTSVDKGDTVMVVWNEDHNNYVIYTEPSASLIMHFLHSDSLSSLGLMPSNSVANNGSDINSRRLFSTGEVTEKEYCQAKKAENRFRVPQGTKFYRVKCKAAFNS